MCLVELVFFTAVLSVIFYKLIRKLDLSNVLKMQITKVNFLYSLLIGFVHEDDREMPSTDYVRETQFSERARVSLVKMAARMTRDPWWKRAIPDSDVEERKTDFRKGKLKPLESGPAKGTVGTAGTSVANSMQFNKHIELQREKRVKTWKETDNLDGSLSNIEELDLISESKNDPQETWVSAGEVEEIVYVGRNDMSTIRPPEHIKASVNKVPRLIYDNKQSSLNGKDVILSGPTAGELGTHDQGINYIRERDKFAEARGNEEGSRSIIQIPSFENNPSSVQGMNQLLSQLISMSRDLKNSNGDNKNTIDTAPTNGENNYGSSQNRELGVVGNDRTSMLLDTLTRLLGISSTQTGVDLDTVSDNQDIDPINDVSPTVVRKATDIPSTWATTQHGNTNPLLPHQTRSRGSLSKDVKDYHRNDIHNDNHLRTNPSIHKGTINQKRPSRPANNKEMNRSNLNYKPRPRGRRPNVNPNDNIQQTKIPRPTKPKTKNAISRIPGKDSMKRPKITKSKKDIRQNRGVFPGIGQRNKKNIAIDSYDPPWMRRSTYILNNGLAGWGRRRRPGRKRLVSSTAVHNPRLQAYLILLKLQLILFFS